jgi:hypothetical protein
MSFFNFRWLQRIDMSDEHRSGGARPAVNGRGVPVAARTGPLELIAGKHLLVLADVENLSISAGDLGRHLRYDSLATLLAASAGRVDGHAFFTRQAGDTRLSQEFEEIGWTPHPRDVQLVRYYGGIKRFANSDHNLCFGAGALVASAPYDLIVIASGDGALGCDLAAAITGAVGAGVATMSLAGSTSHRLRAGENPDILANIEIGIDCLPLRSDQRGCPAPAPLGESRFAYAF